MGRDRGGEGIEESAEGMATDPGGSDTLFRPEVLEALSVFCVASESADTKEEPETVRDLFDSIWMSGDRRPVSAFAWLDEDVEVDVEVEVDAVEGLRMSK